MGKSLVFHKANLIAWILAGMFLTAPESGSAAADTDTGDNRQKLAAFAKKTRLTRPPSVDEGVGETMQITNENLLRTGALANLTEVVEGSAGPTTGEAPGVAELAISDGQADPAFPADDQVLQLKRDYWRNRYLAAKGDLAVAENEILSLDEEIPKLWSRFYSADDPVHRDHVVRLHLDAAISRRKELTRRTETLRQNLPQILGEAKADGALPGWFRDIK